MVGQSLIPQRLFTTIAVSGLIMGQDQVTFLLVAFVPRVHDYPLVICYSLLLKMAIEIVDLPINSMVMFHRFLYVYQVG